jgi:uncharacterized protein with HEPN domain
MHSITSKDRTCLLNMLDAIQKIISYTKNIANADDFNNNNLAFDATLMNFIVIGEMVEKLSDSFLLNTSKLVDWHKVKSFRNILAHNYFGVDAEEVWEIIWKYLPGLKLQVDDFLK